MGQAIIGAAIAIIGGLTTYCLLERKNLLTLLLTVILNGVCGAIIGLMFLSGGMLIPLLWLPAIGLIVVQALIVALLQKERFWGVISGVFTCLVELAVLLPMTVSLDSTAHIAFGILATILAFIATGLLILAFYLTYRKLDNFEGIIIK